MKIIVPRVPLEILMFICSYSISLCYKIVLVCSAIFLHGPSITKKITIFFFLILVRTTTKSIQFINKPVFLFSFLPCCCFAFIIKQQQQKNLHFIYDLSMLCLGLAFRRIRPLMVRVVLARYPSFVCLPLFSVIFVLTILICRAAAVSKSTMLPAFGFPKQNSNRKLIGCPFPHREYQVASVNTAWWLRVKAFSNAKHITFVQHISQRSV
jgi:hypothetical protein